MNIFIYVFLLVSLSAKGQNIHSGLILSLDTKEPIEFVSIFNGKDYTLSNEEGKYRFSSLADSVYFYSPGYDRYNTTFNQLKDTLYLQRSIINLDEVVVTNAKTILQRIKDSISQNYLLTPHTERFFVRVLLKRNDSIVRLQDMYGKLRRKTAIYSGDMELGKNDFEVELMQMRQAGLRKDKDNVYFIFPSFFQILSEFLRINAMGPDFDVIERPLLHSEQLKVDFSLAQADSLNHSKGHYIINNKDNAIQSFDLEIRQMLPKAFQNTQEYNHTSYLERSIYFEKDKVQQKYYMKYGKQKAIVVSKSKEQLRPTTFQIEIILHTTEPLSQLPVRSNLNEQKDVFKLSFPYHEAYWQSQNQLLLTEEMENFILRLNTENTEFKVRNNMN
jgi:hypothetical protein